MPVELLAVAQGQAGVLAAWQLAEHGMHAHHVERRITAGLWRRLSTNTVLTHNIAPTRQELLWAAALHFREAVLTGRAALELEGMPPDSSGRIDLLGRRMGRVEPFESCRVHTSRRPIEAFGTPRRTAIAISVLNSMAWSQSDAQAAFVATTAIQRGLTTLDDLRLSAVAVNGSRLLAKARRRLAIIPEGAHSNLELDFVQLCRRYRLPEPRRQVHRRDSNGRDRYVDALFEVRGRRLVVEIDGLQHLDTAVRIDDQFRANALALGGEPVLRIPGLALRTDPHPFMRQLAEALHQMTVQS